MTEANPADTNEAPPPTPSVMPASVPGAEPAETAPDESSVTKLDESGMDPAAIGEIRKLRRESQKLRERLRAAEEDAERAITQLGALKHSEVERLAGEHLVDPGDVWRAGADFLDEYGAVDPSKVAEAAKGLTAEKPHLAKPQSAPPPSDRPVEGLRAGATPAREPTPAASWQSVIRPRAGRMGIAD